MSRNTQFKKGGTPGGAGVIADVRWGPDFGGEDGDQFNVGVEIDVTDVSLVHEKQVGVNVDIEDIAIESTQSIGVNADIEDVALSHTKSVGCNIDLDNLALSHEKSIGVNADITDVAISNTKSVGVNADITDIALSHTKSVGVDISSLTWQTSDILSPKDVWTPTVALCPDDANKNGTDLEVSGTAAATKDAYIAWDLAGFPSNATVTAATLKLKVKTPPAASQTINTFSLADGDEGWSETGMICSNREPANGANKQAFSSGTTAVELNISLVAAWLTRIEDRMGVGFMTILLQNAAANVLSTIFESADEGTDNALGPRLSITFTTPT
jgi:hypothetical protein